MKPRITQMGTYISELEPRHEKLIIQKSDGVDHICRLTLSQMPLSVPIRVIRGQSSVLSGISDRSAKISG